jgi:opacity protein-like surface antigen
VLGDVSALHDQPQVLLGFSQEVEALFRLAIDIGGFSVGSDFTWQTVAAVNYALSDRVSVSAGYRHLTVDYEDGGQLLDIELSGPLVGATLKF